MAFPFGGKQDASQVGVTLEAHAEQVEHLPLVPVGRGPHRGQRWQHRVVSAGPRLDAQALPPAHREQVIIDLKSRLDRKAVHAGQVGEESELQRGVAAQEITSPAQILPRHGDGQLAAKNLRLSNGRRIPGIQPGDDGVRSYSFRISHASNLADDSAVPVQRAFLPKVNVTGKQDRDVQHHLPKSEYLELPEDVRPGVEEDGLYVEQNK